MAKNKLYIFTTGRSIKYGTNIQVGATLQRIHFEPTSYLNRIGESKFSTGDPKVAEAVRKHPRFGELIFEVDPEPVPIPKESLPEILPLQPAAPVLPVADELQAAPANVVSETVLNNVSEGLPAAPAEPASVDYRTFLSNPDSAESVDSVTSIAKAKNWLQATHKAKFVATAADEIRQEAAAKYNTLFPNWN